MNYHPFFLYSFLFIFGLLSCKETPQAVSENPVGKRIAQLADSGRFNGVVLLADNSGILLHQAYGIRNPRSQASLTKDSPFYLASVSKHITCLAILLLEQAGKLELADKLSDYYPELSYADSVNLFQMMTHTSGIPDYYGLGLYKPGMTNQDVLTGLLDGTKLDFEPGTQYSYSNSAYVLLSMVAEKASEMSFREWVHQQIFTPLEMKQSQVHDQTAPELADRAIGFKGKDTLLDYDGYTTGGGGIYSNAHDLYLLETALFGEKILPQSVLSRAYQPTPLADGETSYYGFGWRINPENPDEVMHSGSLAGFRTFVFKHLGTQQILILLTNNSNEELGAIAEELMELM